MKARQNPFRVDRIHALQFRFLTGDLSAVLDRLQILAFTGAIVGPHGTGKSTLLAELVQVLGGQGRGIRRQVLTEANRTSHRREVAAWLATAMPDDILVLDGAEQLDRRTWRQVQRTAKRCSGLLITTHQPGLLPTLYECRSSRQLLSDLVQELLGPQYQIASEDLSQMLIEHSGNVRECLRSLYDRFSELD